MTDFLHKWELPLRAYAQLRTQEVNNKKKKHSAAQLLTPSSLAAEQFSLIL